MFTTKNFYILFYFEFYLNIFTTLVKSFSHQIWESDDIYQSSLENVNTSVCSF